MASQHRGAAPLVKTPEPPYYAVIFSSVLSPDVDGYAEMSATMDELAARQEGYLGHESARGDDGIGITVSYWRDEAAIARWYQNAEHRVAQRFGRERWYKAYSIRVAKVERAHGHATSDASIQKAV